MDEGASNDAHHRSEADSCFHCGLPCRAGVWHWQDHAFCCQGCQTVCQLLTENGLGNFYDLAQNAGQRMDEGRGADRFDFADEPAVRERLVDFSDGKETRVRFRVPAIHCIACVWLLENLYRLNPGMGKSEVNFPRQEVSLSFDEQQLKLSDVIGLLASIGYEPDLKFADLDLRSRPSSGERKRLWIQLGVAGFAFGNIMLFSLPSYFGLNHFNEPEFARLFGWASALLALPVVFYSALDYWKTAWRNVRQRQLQIEVPIALGLAALFGQSLFDVWSGRGEGYFDTLAGLVFFLLIGRAFQRKTYERLSFERDYKSFFPLSVTRRKNGDEERVSLANLEVGDALIVRHGEIIPADARLVSGRALVDYSFVTGESEPVEKHAGDLLYAGGRQMGGAMEAATVKPVSQSYLTSLWTQEVFRKESRETVQNLTNRFSRHFVKAVIAVAAGAALYWAWVGDDLGRAWLAFAAVLIVACPCALALAAPFALGTAQRELGRRHVYLKSPDVIEALGRIDTVVFDKTGTLTSAGDAEIQFHGETLSEAEAGWIYSMTRHSTHPHAVRLREWFGGDQYPDEIRTFVETPGLGMEGRVMGHEIWMGSASWLESRGANVPSSATIRAGQIHVAIDGAYRGTYQLTHPVSPETVRMLERFGKRHELALLSGDQPREKEKFRAWLGPRAHLAFEQSPVGKLNYIHERQAEGRSVMMVGDGLNDAGALKQGDVGVAVVERCTSFSPASDVIMAARQVPNLDRLLGFSRATLGVVKLCLGVSVVYNVVGVTIAAQGLMSPVICAILMPVSSVTVVGLATGLTSWLVRRQGWEPARDMQFDRTDGATARSSTVSSQPQEVFA